MQVNVIKGDKGAEDWDHEANAADDDEDMGEQDDPNNRDASPPPRQSVSSLSAACQAQTLRILDTSKDRSSSTLV